MPTWMTNVFRLSRRMPGRPAARPPDAMAGPVPDGSAEERLDVELTIPRARLDGFAAVVGGGAVPSGPHSPAGLTAAIAGAIDRAGGRGSPSVSRSPAGVYTPEYWRFRIEAADPIARALLDRAGRAGPIA